jgi:hypothetical protein
MIPLTVFWAAYRFVTLAPAYLRERREEREFKRIIALSESPEFQEGAEEIAALFIQGVEDGNIRYDPTDTRPRVPFGPRP